MAAPVLRSRNGLRSGDATGKRDGVPGCPGVATARFMAAFAMAAFARAANVDRTSATPGPGGG